MTILVMADKYRGTLTSAEANAAIVDGLRQAGIAETEIVTAEMADGGEGTAAILKRLCPEAVVIESAQCIGYDTTEGRKPPMERSSRPLGVAIRHALLAHPDRTVYVCLGGTATLDLGRGLLQGLGVVDGDASAVPPGHVHLLCDVSGPAEQLLDFAPQKGFTPVQCEDLRQLIASLGPSSPHAACAGGCAWALETLRSPLRVTSEAGAACVMRMAGIDRMHPDLVISGEGCLDSTSLMGKATSEAMRLAREKGAACLLVPGIE